MRQLPGESRSAAATPRYLFCLFLLFWCYSFAGTTDLVNWWIENILVIGFVVLLVATLRQFRFRNSSYALILLFLLLHTYGARYAYADNPLGAWMQQQWGLSRNPYDRIVHCSFGLLLALPMRDLFLHRWKLSNRVAWILPVEVVLSLSGLFELVEWCVADYLTPAHGDTYVGTQGDIWDAQKDMALATGGALLTILLARAVARKAGRLHHQQSGAV